MALQAKHCQNCNEDKPLWMFKGKHRDCRHCVINRGRIIKVTAEERSKNLQRLYGITLEDKFALYEQQKSKCAVCQLPMSLAEVHIDHDHASERVRGLLCHHCNTGLGLFRDNPEFLEAAKRYLLRAGVSLV